jgi:hypothetical protein
MLIPSPPAEVPWLVLSLIVISCELMCTKREEVTNLNFYKQSKTCRENKCDPLPSSIAELKLGNVNRRVPDHHTISKRQWLSSGCLIELYKPQVKE